MLSQHLEEKMFRRVVVDEKKHLDRGYEKKAILSENVAGFGVGRVAACPLSVRWQ